MLVPGVGHCQKVNGEAEQRVISSLQKTENQSNRCGLLLMRLQHGLETAAWSRDGS